MKRLLIILIFLLLFLFPKSSIASCWIADYGETFEDVLVTSEDRVFAVGSALLSTDLQGKPLQAMTTAHRDLEAHKVVLTPKEELIVAGKNFIAKFGQNGEPLWMKKLNVTDVAVAPNGDIIFVFENVLASLTPEGQIKWVKVVVEPDQGFLRFSGVATSENEILVVGYSFASEGNNDYNAWIGYFDFEGNIIWQKSLDLGYDELTEKVYIANNSAILVGVSGSQHAPWIGEYFVVKLNKEGNVIWAREILPRGLPEGISTNIFWSLKINDIDCNSEGKCLIGGNFITLLLDENGSLLWTKSFSSNGVALTDSLAISAKNVLLAFPINGSDAIGTEAQVTFSAISPKLLPTKFKFQNSSITVENASINLVPLIVQGEFLYYNQNCSKPRPSTLNSTDDEDSQISPQESTLNAKVSPLGLYFGGVALVIVALFLYLWRSR
ncbi:hypothetical protein K1720_06435 [Thermococcus argininiproducens]|uniref:Uncharacterized protein n=1 Tax=Thermococcus argininiproducens TaxID=2866384 RepID=A0A9E7M9L6_9EURY|nr:hypothetical protein [Thermococcus argininiproducens]USG99182.1 hypothetical protein K1720_06435 [Thermococcus argininiproducens]